MIVILVLLIVCYLNQLQKTTRHNASLTLLLLANVRKAEAVCGVCPFCVPSCDDGRYGCTANCCDCKPGRTARGGCWGALNDESWCSNCPVGTSTNGQSGATCLPCAKGKFSTGGTFNGGACAPCPVVRVLLGRIPIDFVNSQLNHMHLPHDFFYRALTETQRGRLLVRSVQSCVSSLSCPLDARAHN